MGIAPKKNIVTDFAAPSVVKPTVVQAGTENATKQHEFLQGTIDSLPAMISQWDPDLKNMSTNRPCANFFGKTPEQMNGTNFRDLLASSFVLAQAQIEKSLNGESTVFECEVQAAGGITRRLRFSLQPKMEVDKITSFFAVAVDITEQHESAFRFQQIANVIDEVFWMTDLEKERIVYISPGYEKIWGLTCESLYRDPRSFIAAIHPEDRDRVIKAFAMQADGTYNETYRIIRCDGAVRWIHDRSFSPIYLAEDERRVVGVAKDITENRQVAMDLQQEQNKMKAAFENVDMGIVLVSGSGDFTSMNRAALRCYDFQSESQCRLSVNEIAQIFELRNFDGQLIPFSEWPLQRAVRGDYVRNFEALILNRKTNREWIGRLAYSPVKDEAGQVSLIILTVLDITAEKVAERNIVHSSKLATLGEMSAEIAHEINNPLTIISSSLTLLESARNQPDVFGSRLMVAQKAIDRIVKIIKGLGRFSRSSETSEFEAKKIAVLAQESAALSEAKLKVNYTRVELDLRSDAAVICKEVEIEQVLINLLSNAIDSVAEQDERWVRMSVFEEGDDVLVQVTDSGKGVTKENENRIFQPFFTTKPIGKGTGIGLSICRSILKRNHATIVLNQKVNRTCFELRFPIFRPGQRIP